MSGVQLGRVQRVGPVSGVKVAIGWGKDAIVHVAMAILVRRDAV